MRQKPSGVAVGLLSIGVVATAHAEPAVEALLCKRSQEVIEYTAKGDIKSQKLVLDIRGDQPAAIGNPDGTRKLVGAAKGGFAVVDLKTNRKRTIHNRARSYDCDQIPSDESTFGSVRWLGSDVVFAQGLLCEEFDARPFVANAKTGKFLAALKLPGATPEAIYNVAHVDKQLWAISIYDHNSAANRVIVVDTKTGKTKASIERAAGELTNLPACTL
jgi:hypothetical protein